MKRKSTELDVDFIGGQGPLTKDEQYAISEYIKTQKALRAKKKSGSNQRNRKKESQRRKVVA